MSTHESITLSRAEALAVESLLIWTSGDFLLDCPPSNPHGVEAAIRRLRLEAEVRDGAGWWDRAARPGQLDMREHFGEGACPETFVLLPKAVRALRELLPIAFDDALKEDVETVLALMGRLGVPEVAQ